VGARKTAQTAAVTLLAAALTRGAAAKDLKLAGEHVAGPSGSPNQSEVQETAGKRRKAVNEPVGERPGPLGEDELSPPLSSQPHVPKVPVPALGSVTECQLFQPTLNGHSLGIVTGTAPFAPQKGEPDKTKEPDKFTQAGLVPQLIVEVACFEAHVQPLRIDKERGSLVGTSWTESQVVGVAFEHAFEDTEVAAPENIRRQAIKKVLGPSGSSGKIAAVGAAVATWALRGGMFFALEATTPGRCTKIILDGTWIQYPQSTSYQLVALSSSAAVNALTGGATTTAKLQRKLDAEWKKMTDEVLSRAPPPVVTPVKK
jgi:hypothetical protein